MKNEMTPPDRLPGFLEFDKQRDGQRVPYYGIRPTQMPNDPAIQTIR